MRRRSAPAGAKQSAQARGRGRLFWGWGGLVAVGACWCHVVRGLLRLCQARELCRALRPHNLTFFKLDQISPDAHADTRRTRCTSTDPSAWADLELSLGTQWECDVWRVPMADSPNVGKGRKCFYGWAVRTRPSPHRPGVSVCKPPTQDGSSDRRAERLCVQRLLGPQACNLLDRPRSNCGTRCSWRFAN